MSYTDAPPMIAASSSRSTHANSAPVPASQARRLAAWIAHASASVSASVYDHENRSV
jgi:hypothetical protein